jgi:hypothetical protein
VTSEVRFQSQQPLSICTSRVVEQGRFLLADVGGLDFVGQRKPVLSVYATSEFRSHWRESFEQQPLSCVQRQPGTASKAPIVGAVR